MKINFKKLVFAVLVATLHSVNLSAQICNRSVTAFTAAPGGYTINGSALLEDNNGVLMLYFNSGFSTTSGPDLHVYLATNFAAPTTSGNTNIDLGPLVSTSGQQAYAVNPGVMLGDFNYVLIHCNTFNHFWGGGLLDSINCSTGIPVSHNLEEMKIFPNPSNGKINIKNLYADTKLTLFDLQGRNILTQTNISDGPHNFTFLEKGIYILQLVNETKLTTTRLIIE